MFKIAMIDDDSLFLDQLEKLCNVYFIKHNKKCEIRKINPLQLNPKFFETYDLIFLVVLE